MALTANVVPKYKGLVSTHPQLEDSSVSDDGEIQTTQGRAIEVVTTVTSPYTVLDTDEMVICNVLAPYDVNNHGHGFVVNLPVAEGLGRRITVKNINTQHVEVTPNGTDTIEEKNLSAVVCYQGAVKLIDYAANKWIVVN